jgi:hypothetical protein
VANYSNIIVTEKIIYSGSAPTASDHSHMHSPAKSRNKSSGPSLADTHTSSKSKI